MISLPWRGPFDTVPEHYKKFAVFDVLGDQLGWVRAETEWEALADWNRELAPSMNLVRTPATSAVEIPE